MGSVRATGRSRLDLFCITVQCVHIRIQVFNVTVLTASQEGMDCARVGTCIHRSKKCVTDKSKACSGIKILT